MDYSDLDVYKGTTSCCDNCQKAFKVGDVVTVVTDPDLVFCYSDAYGKCLEEYLFFKMKEPEMLIGNAMVYHERPLVVMPTRAEISFVQKIKNFFGLGR